MNIQPFLRLAGLLLGLALAFSGQAQIPFSGTYRGTLYNTNSAGEHIWLGISRVEFTVEPDGKFKVNDQLKGTVAADGAVTFDQPGVGVTSGQVTGTRMTASQTTGTGGEGFTIRFEADRFGDLLPTWTDIEPTLGLPANHGWISVVAGNGKFVATTAPLATTAGWTSLHSTDGRTWTQHPIDLGVGASDRTYGYPVFFADGRFWFSVCGDNAGGPNTRIYSSTDGVAWSVVDLGVKYGGVLGLAHGGGRYVALLARNGQADVRVLTSTDGASWALGTVGPANFNPERLAYANGRFVIGQDRNRSHVSIDGLTWREVAFPEPQFGARELAGNNGRFVAGASGVVVSPDGENWHAPSPGPGASFRALDAGEGFFYAQPAVNGVPLYRSTDGEHWRKVVRTPPSGTFYFVEQLAVLGNIVVAGAQQSLLVAELGAGEGYDVVLPPLILKQPAPLTRNLRAGDNADLSADVETGGSATTLQWTRDGQVVPGATNRSLSFFPVLTTHAGTWVLTVSNALGVVTTTPVVVNVTDPKTKPTIQFQPAAQSVAAGANAFFGTFAQGSPLLSYQWRKDGENLPGATSSGLQITYAVPSDVGDYTVVVSNPYGSVTSSVAKLTVTGGPVAPRIVTGPTNLTVVAGETGTLTVVAKGTEPLTYQWKQGENNVPNGTGPTLTFNPAVPADAGSYTVVVSNGQGTVTSTAVTVKVEEPVAPTTPTIAVQPQSKSVLTGANVTFNVTATGTAPLAYQWRKNGENIPGATAASFTLNGVALTDAGDFTVVVSNAQGNVTSEVAKLTVNPALVGPAITQPPLAQTVVAGVDVSFSVTATGTAPLSYQWRKDGENLPGATAATLSLPDVTAAAAGDYSVVVGNEAGTVTSATARLTVNVPPAIAVQPLSRTVTVGSAANFTVQATGTAPLAFQWRRNGNPITGATTAAYAINAAALTDAGDFTVVISNVAGSITSSVAKLTVESAPVAPAIVTQPSAHEILRGSVAELSVTATGTGPLAYQWYRGAAGDTANPFAGVTDFAAALAGLVADTSVWVRVSNAVGHADSDAVTLTVHPLRLVASGRSLGVPPGGTARLEVIAESTVPLTYQWYRGAPGDTGTPFAEANAASFVTPPVNESGTYWVRVANEFGVRDSTAYTVTPAAFAEIPEVPMAPESLSPVSGLYTRTVTVRNLTAGVLPGFTLLVDTGSPDVDVWNASGSGGGRFQIAWQRSLGAGEAVNLVVEFYSRVRPWTGTPRFEVSPEVVSLPPGPDGTPFSVDRVVPLDAGSLLIEFSATPGRRYFIEYGDNLAEWIRSPLGVTAGGTRVQWVDSGPPKTFPAPNGESQRYYRVIAVPTAN